MKWREKFLVYGSYCANLTKATTTLQELCDNNENFNMTIIVSVFVNDLFLYRKKLNRLYLGV